MGEVINVHCKACKKGWQCFTGNGLQHGRKEMILAAFPAQDRQQVESLLAASMIPAYDFRYGLAVCVHCHNVVAVPVLRAVDSEDICVGRCPLCGEKTKSLCAEEQSAEEWSKKTACPVCKSHRLQTETVGDWD